jgi:glycosyltransferase involved in cell wall biosynthesis
VFRASKHIEVLLSQIDSICTPLYSLEVILVDDFSNDATSELIRQLIPQYPRLHISLISLRRNLGQVAATAIGLAHARNDLILTMDDDLQHNLDDVQEFVEKFENSDLDFVVAKFKATHKSILQRIAGGLAHRLGSLKYKTPKEFGFSSFCMYKSTFIQSAALMSRSKIDVGWMFELSGKYANINLVQKESIRSTSTYTLKSLTRVSRPLLSHIFSLLIKPIAILGLSSGLLSLCVLFYYLWFFFHIGSPIPGFATLTILMLVSIGISSLFLFATMTTLREIRSLINNRISNAVGSMEGQDL